MIRGQLSLEPHGDLIWLRQSRSAHIGRRGSLLLVPMSAATGDNIDISVCDQRRYRHFSPARRAGSSPVAAFLLASVTLSRRECQVINYRLTATWFVITSVTNPCRPAFHWTANCQPRQVGTTPSRSRCKSPRDVSYEVIFAEAAAASKSGDELCDGVLAAAVDRLRVGLTSGDEAVRRPMTSPRGDQLTSQERGTRTGAGSPPASCQSAELRRN